MQPSEDLAIKIIDALKTVDLMFGYNKFKQTYQADLILCYNIGLISDVQLEDAIDEAVINQARRDYNILTSGEKTMYGGMFTNAPDHLRMPECLAYALETEEFSEAEIGKIPGGSLDTFIEIYGQKKLIENMRKRLVNPEAVAERREALDS